jgi:hypothetical protein
MTPEPEPRRLLDRATGEGGWMIPGELEQLVIRAADGRTVITARVPRIERRFSSPMHTAAGMTPRLGSWREELAAFLNGLLPSARLREDTSRDSERAALRGAVIRALEEGFSASLVVDDEGEVSGRVARPERIARTVDLDALEHDYLAWLAAAGVDGALGDGEDAADIIEQVRWAIDDLREKCWSEYLHSLGDERYYSAPVMGAIIDGLITGDDPAQTCAFLLRDLTGDQRLWEPAR